MSDGPLWKDVEGRLVEMKMRAAAETANFCLWRIGHVSGSPIEAALHRSLIALAADRNLGIGVSSHLFSRPAIFGETLRWITRRGYRMLEWGGAFAVGGDGDYGTYEDMVPFWDSEFPGNGTIDIFPQARIGKYSVDLLVCRGGVPQPNVLAIECDGHDFHEKTKEQARHDKQRDRHILAAGISTVRFTGSEIWRDPDSCAREAVALLLSSDDEQAVLAARRAREQEGRP
jgi:very-short-patch-repair endonuclease